MNSVHDQEPPESRVAWSIAQRPGVGSLVLTNPGGRPIASLTAGDASREGALGAFITSRAWTLAGDGDLRGMGRQLIGSTLRSITLVGPAGDYAVLPFAGGAIFTAMDRGTSAERIIDGLREIVDSCEPAAEEDAPAWAGRLAS